MRSAAVVTLLALSASTTVHAQASDGWRIHDMARPHPPVVTPTPAPLTTAPPPGALVLFSGRELSHWVQADGKPARWVVRNGYFEVLPGSGDLQTIDSLGDMQLHLEWAAPVPAKGAGQDRGNSGVFLMSRYELQVLDSWHNDTYADGQAAAMYGQYPPLFNASRPPGEWQSYDVSFRRPRFDASGALVAPARITVLHNGVLVQDNVEILGPTSWLMRNPYVAHPDRLPLKLQDHSFKVRYRNIWVRPLPEAAPAPEYPASAQLSAVEQEAYVGRYDISWGHADILIGAGHLALDLGDGPMPIVADERGGFSVMGVDAKLTFGRGPGGEVTGFSMEIGGETWHYTRAR
jgi:hypothetical protein